MAARSNEALPSRAALNIRCAKSMVSGGSSDTVRIFGACAYQLRWEAANQRCFEPMTAGADHDIRVVA